jgi:hypothetical protein
MLADIATGHSAGGDALFLIAAVLFGIAAVLELLRKPDHGGILVAGGLALLAVAWLIL